MNASNRCGLVVLLAAMAWTTPARAEEASTTKQIALGPEYDASAFHSFWLGSGYRDLWTTPITIPVLDLRTYAGGLTPVRTVGGLQTPGLALRGADGRAYTFRSLRKEPDRSLPVQWRSTWAAWVVRDHTSSTHPGAALLLPPLAEAAGLMHTEPQIVVVPDDSLLGNYREKFAGLPGTIEEYPRAGANAPSFEGATEIVSTRELWNRWLEGPENRVNSRAFLRARILDLYVANWDRHRGQWRWVRKPEDEVWEPLPEDPDMAFIRNDGMAVGMARSRDPKLVRFDDGFPKKLEGSVINGAEVDRWLLTDLDRQTFEDTARELQGRFSDDVIDGAIRRLPPEWQAMQKNVVADLRSRRAKLIDEVMHYYRNLAEAVDVHATDRDEIVTVQRGDAGALEVTIALADQSEPYYHRRFLSSETHEVRIYLHGGDDQVERRGPAGGPIPVRVIAGDGHDLVDDSASGGTDIWAGPGSLADKSGKGTHTHSAWSNPEPDSTAPWLEPRNWGHWTLPSAEVAYGTDVGLVLGLNVVRSDWGFRTLPEAKHQRLSALWSTAENRGRLSYQGIFRRPGNKRSFQVDALASGIERIYFFGFGNETTVPPSRNEYRTAEQLIDLYPSWSVEPSRDWSLHIGPTYRASWSPNDRDNILNAVEPYGLGHFAEAGLRAGLQFDSRHPDKPSAVFEYQEPEGGVLSSRLNVDGFYMPAVLNVDRAFGGVEGEAASYVGREDDRAQLAVRVGAKHVIGDYPWFESAFLGGRSSLSGYNRNRFAGDTSLYGGVEGRAWLLTLDLLPVPCRLGVIGLADVGRVWLSSEDSDSWHNSWGGGAMIQPVATHFSLSGTVAKSPDQTKFYLTTRALF